MDRCPDLDELTAFFGVAAVAAYGNEGIGWYYDQLKFATGNESMRIVCEIEPAERAFSLLYIECGRKVIDISLQYVVSLDLESSAGTETLVGRVSQGGVEQLFKLTLDPLTFRLGTGLPG